MAQY
jgi:hypothetical protein